MSTLYGVQKIKTGQYMGYDIFHNNKIYTFKDPDFIAVFDTFIELSDAVARVGEDPKNIKIVELVPKDV